MNTNIKATGVTITPEINDYITKRLEKISKLLENDSTAQCDIEIARTTEHHQKGEIFRAELHIVAAGKNCYSSSEKGDLLSAIDDAKDLIMRELTGIKAKKVSLMRRSGSRVKNMMKGLWPWGK